MSTYRNTPGFTAFKASQSGNSMVDGVGQQLTVRKFVDTKGAKFNLLTKWSPGRGATQIVLDELDRPLKTTFHPAREGDAWEEMKQKLALDGIELLEP